MNAYQAYQYYLAIKLHFTQPSYDVFVSRGKVRTSPEAFAKRNDRLLFEKISNKLNDDKSCIQFFAANFMYGNKNVVYCPFEEAMANYMQFIKYKQSITRVFQDDLNTIEQLEVCHDFSKPFGNYILQMFLMNKITLESTVILDSLENITDNDINPFMADTIHLISKSRGFVKFNKSKIVKVYCQFLKEIKCNG